MTVDLLAPAKINLGLEVIGKRNDGYHDIATVFQTISLFDQIRIEQAAADSVQIVDRIIQLETNLAEQALTAVRTTGSTGNSYRVAIEKRIPLAAGLGGASSDAAAVLVALGARHSIDETTLARLALHLGSDVPFLLRGGAALATGRGENLESIPSLRHCWIVLACPEFELERKTARLYEALTAEDFSDGQRAERVALALRAHVLPSPGDLANAFTRPLQHILPNIVELAAAFTEAGAPFVALSGAGPTHYTFVPRLHDAIAISHVLTRQAPLPVRILIARPVATGIQIRSGKTPVASGAL